MTGVMCKRVTGTWFGVICVDDFDEVPPLDTSDFKASASTLATSARKS
jgi:hypothetical protein